MELRNEKRKKNTILFKLITSCGSLTKAVKRLL